MGLLENPFCRTINVARGANHAATASLVRRVAGEASATDFFNTPTVTYFGPLLFFLVRFSVRFLRSLPLDRVDGLPAPLGP